MIFVFICSMCFSSSDQFSPAATAIFKHGRAIFGSNSIADCISLGHESQDACTENQRDHSRLQTRMGAYTHSKKSSVYASKTASLIRQT